jgi:hypothetical protein
MFGVTPMEVRKLAYECAVTFNIKVPDIWKENNSVGPDWLSGFLKRNTDRTYQSGCRKLLALCGVPLSTEKP